MGNFFHQAYQTISKNRWWTFLFLAIISISFAAIISRIQFDDDISSLIPQNEESRKVQEILKSIAFTDKIIVNITRNEDASVDELIQYARVFLDSIQKNKGEYIKSIQGKIEDEDLPKTLELVYENLPLFLNKSDYEIINQRLKKDSIASITKRNYQTLTSPSGVIAKRTIAKDPLGLSFMALKKLRNLGIGEGFLLKNGFLLDERERSILLFITPSFASGETDKNTPFVEYLYHLQNQLDEAYNDKVSGNYYGAALVAVGNAKQIKKDIQLTASIALTILLIILILFYRKITLPIILFLPTVFGGLTAIVFLVLIRSKISAISLGIGSVLLGVTLDYSLHILTHIRNGKSLKNLFKDVAPSIMMSSLTTASAFLCLLFLKSQALQDLGVFAAISVLGASVFALLFIPQVYTFKGNTIKKSTVLDKFAAYGFHKNKWAIALLAIIIVGSIFTYKRVIFNQDITKLNYETEILTEARQRLEAITDIGSKSIYISTYGQNKEVVLQQNDSLFEELNRLKNANEIVSFSSIGTLIRSDKKQREKIELWKTFWDSEKIKQTKQELLTSGSEFGFKPSTHQRFYNLLDKDFQVLKSEDLSTISSLPIEDYIVSDSLSTTITSLVKIEDSNIKKLIHSFSGKANTLLINRQQVNETFLGNLKNDFNKLIWYSLFVVLIILLLFYRSLSLTLITVIPLFLSWFLTLGLMGVFKIEFNIFNIIISSFIFGLGVDYCIFITNGLLTEYRTGEKAVSTHKTSIVLSVITTLLGIGVLIFAKHPALYSVSAVCVIGILSALVMAFTIQPLLFHLFLGSTNKRPIQPRILIHSLFSFGYFDLGGLLLSAYAWIVMKINPGARMKEQITLHKITSKFMKSVLYTNPFLAKKVINEPNETFDKPAMLVANHTSFLDILAMGMLHPKLIYLVKDHVYNSPTVGSAARLHGAYPVSGGIENGEQFLQQKIDQGFSIVAFPEGTRSTTNKIHRFHKGAFYLAEKFNLDIVPVMIHGGSEVSPKGSFIIRDGSFTIKILPRIKASDTSYGETYSQRPKRFGQYFRQAFRTFRNEIEGETYWHKLLLENYRHKGNHVYSAVKSDIERYRKSYHDILRILNEKDSIIHLSNGWGQFDLFMALDSIDRKIYSHLQDEKARLLLKNNYLTHQYSKIEVLDEYTLALAKTADILIIDSGEFLQREGVDKKIDEISILILLKSAISHKKPIMERFSFIHSMENEDVVVLKKKTEYL